jgi:hypothetical protein
MKEFESKDELAGSVSNGEPAKEKSNPRIKVEKRRRASPRIQSIFICFNRTSHTLSPGSLLYWHEALGYQSYYF